VGCGSEASPTDGTDTTDVQPDPDASESSGGASDSSGADGMASTGEPAPDPALDPAWAIPPRSATRTCRFGAASDGPWIGGHGGHGGQAPPPGVAPLDVPDRLSDARCFADLPRLVPSADVAPYELNTPLWTDDAHKHRFLVLPPGRAIEVQADGRWMFPAGAAILKVFAVERVLGDPSSAVPVETRVMIRRADAWEFYTYRWDEDGRDASRIEGGVVVEIVQQDGADTTTLPYLFPAQLSCRTCHRPGDAHEVLGPRTEQIGRWRDTATGPQNQLEALSEAGWIEGATLDELLAWPTYPDPADESAPLEARARAYLQGNCAHCHRDGGWQPIDMDMDLDFETPLHETAICDVPLQYWSPWVEGGKRIAPGNPDDSNLLQRMMVRGDGQMPLVATYRVDPLGVEVVRAWIESLDGCPSE
jgi:uncharacterized repeat protein (TIGR03806 family)